MQVHSLGVGSRSSSISSWSFRALCFVSLWLGEHHFPICQPLKTAWRAVHWVDGTLPWDAQLSSTLASLFHTDYARFCAYLWRLLSLLSLLMVLGLRHPSFCFFCMNKCLHRTVVKWPPLPTNSHGRHFFLFYLVDNTVAGREEFHVEWVMSSLKSRYCPTGDWCD